MHNLPNLADRQDPKGNGLRLHSTLVCSYHSDEARRTPAPTAGAVKHHPKVAKQGTPGTGKPAMALCKKKAAKPYAVAE